MQKHVLSALVWLATIVPLTAGDVKSGLPVGDYPGPFNVADITGPAAGQELCYRCRYGNQPVVSVFSRKLDANTIKLIREIDSTIGKNRDSRMAGFVVLLTDKPHEQQDKLRKLATEHKIRHMPLTVYHNTKGPTRYRINEKATTTVLMWVESDVKANHAVSDSNNDLTMDKITAIVKDTRKILE